LKNIPLFLNLDDNSIELIINKMTKESYQKDSTIFTEGSESNTMFIIDSGSIQLSNHGQNLPTIHYHHGEYFNDFSLVSKKINNYTAFTTQATTVWFLSAFNFKLIMHKIGIIFIYIHFFNTLLN
jgi:CRP-like cAMP-binding protein